MRALATLLAVALLILPAIPAGLAQSVAPMGDSLDAIEGNLALPAATAYNDQDGDKVFDSLARQYLVTGTLTLPTIVTFTQGSDVDAAMAAAKRAAPGLAPTYLYATYGGFAAPLRMDQALAIAALPAVRQVEWSQPGTLELDTATLNMNVDAVQSIGVTGTGFADGNGSLVAILDTGFDGQHADLAGKFVRFIDWSDGQEKDPYDSGTHGTHVASITAGLGAGDARYVGVAPGAQLVGFMISTTDAKAAAIASIDYLLEHRPDLPVDVLTISFGFGTTVDGTDALELAMDKAWEAGITTFKSTGNSGPGRGTVTIPGGARGIIGTASIYEPGEGGFRLSSFSSRGPTVDGRIKPDLAAPGSSIEAAAAGTVDGYVSMSGTSMASTFAAGVAALIKSVDSSLTPDDIRRIMTETAADWGPAGKDVEYGHGRIDALRAVQLAALEKTTRLSLQASWLAQFDIAGTVVPGHQHGTLTGQGASASFQVEDASQMLAVTFIANHSIASPAGGLDAFAAVVRDPDGVIVASLAPGALGDVPTFGLGVDATSGRQQTVSVQPSITGGYTIEVVSGGHDEVLWDVSAGLPANEVEGLLSPFLAATAQQGVSESEPLDAAGPGVIVLVAALLGLGLRRRQA